MPRSNAYLIYTACVDSLELPPVCDCMPVSDCLSFVCLMFIGVFEGLLVFCYLVVSICFLLCLIVSLLSTCVSVWSCVCHLYVVDWVDCVFALLFVCCSFDCLSGVILFF